MKNPQDFCTQNGSVLLPFLMKFMEEKIMSKPKSLAEQIEEIEAAQEKLSDYEKLFDKACQINFGCNAKTIRKVLDNSEEPCSSFETKMRTFFCLKTDKDVADFVAVMCTESSLNFFKNKRGENNV